MKILFVLILIALMGCMQNMNKYDSPQETALKPWVWEFGPPTMIYPGMRAVCIWERHGFGIVVSAYGGVKGLFGYRPRLSQVVQDEKFIDWFIDMVKPKKLEGL